MEYERHPMHKSVTERIVQRLSQNTFLNKNKTVNENYYHQST